MDPPYLVPKHLIGLSIKYNADGGDEINHPLVIIGPGLELMRSLFSLEYYVS